MHTSFIAWQITAQIKEGDVDQGWYLTMTMTIDRVKRNLAPPSPQRSSHWSVDTSSNHCLAAGIEAVLTRWPTCPPPAKSRYSSPPIMQSWPLLLLRGVMAPCRLRDREVVPFRALEARGWSPP